MFNRLGNRQIFGIYQSHLQNGILVHMDNDRIKTGIEGVDELLNGGFRKGDVVGIVGDSGAGKTILCTQFLYKGAVDYGEKGLLILVEERPDDLRRDMLDSFGWGLKALESSGDLFIEIPIDWKMVEDERKSEEICLNIQRLVNKYDVKRVVIDSISALVMEDNPIRVRDFLYSLFIGLLEEGATTLVTLEKSAYQGGSRWGLENFLARGVIELHVRKQGGVRTRSIEILKTRGSPHSMEEHLMKIGKDGITVFPDEIVKG